jgi:putative ABC transport system ATP-binding protein
MNEIVLLENVSRVTSDGHRSVNGVSLAINERERVVIRGPAGSGKTSLMRLIAGMDVPDSGQVFVAGQPMHEMGTNEAAAFRSRMVGVCLRDPALMPCLTLWENVAMPLTVQGVSAAQRRKAAMEQLKALGVAYAAHARPAALSPYERKLASLARAFVAKPPFLLLDECAADLPEREATRLMDLAWALAKERNLTVVCCASGQDSLNTDRSFVMEHGRITEESR